MKSSTFLWTLRRELWENRAVWQAPIGTAALSVLAFLVTVPALPRRVAALSSSTDMEAAHLGVHGPYGAVAIVGFAIAFVMSVFYCAETLQGERRDRSILFWKSLPVSDTTTVLAKAAVPLLVVPAVVFLSSAAAQLVMALVSALVLAGDDAGRALLWANVQPFAGVVTVGYVVAAIALWHAPIYGWLLLVSAWARRAVLLWAVVPLLAIAGIERIVLGSLHFVGFLEYLAIGWVHRGLAFSDDEVSGMSPLMDALTPGRLLLTPGVWIGLAFAAACLAGAAMLRRRGEPI